METTRPPILQPLDPAHLRIDPARLAVPRLPAALVERRQQAFESALGAARTVPGKLGPVGPEIRRRLVERATLGWTVAEQEVVDDLGYDAYLERQLNPESIDDFGLEQVLEDAFPSLPMSPGERLITYHETPEVPIFELLIATVLRAIYSPRQLFERLVVFWTDHFNVNLFGDRGIWLKPTDDREVIRRHAMGSFPDLLRASAHSAAMLDYLTNDSNVQGHPNENYSRELMELHTLGVDGGFTEEDVREVARALTGWTFEDYQTGLRFGRFRFAAANHDNGPKTVLGHALPAGGGRADGETVLEILAHHPSTARFVATKLLRYFWGYEPQKRVVDWLSRIYLRTGGDVRTMLRAVLARPRMADATPKLKRPFHLVTSTVRALFAQVDNPFFLIETLFTAGQLPFNWGPPNGYPDSDVYWSGFVLPRWNFAAEIAADRSGLTIDLPFLDPGLPVDELVTILDQLLLGGTATPTTRDAVATFLAAAPVTRRRLGEAAGLYVAAPEFQRY